MALDECLTVMGANSSDAPGWTVMQCREFREIADSYLGEELLVETNHEVLRHLDTCAACRAELEERRQLRTRVKAAFAADSSLQPQDEFVERLSNELRHSARQREGGRPWWRLSRPP